MIQTPDFPRVGDLAVDFYEGNAGRRDLCGENVTVTRITATMVITSDGERYRAGGRTLYPVNHGRYSDRQLLPADDVRVLIVRGRDQLAAIARLTDNLSRLDHSTPESVLTALSQIIVTATGARKAVVQLLGGDPS